jgi:hypothetical protein
MEDLEHHKTYYIARETGEDIITRYDSLPEDHGVAMQDLLGHGLIRNALMISMGSLSLGLEEKENQQAGLDGFPISAVEAREILEHLSNSPVLDV